MRFVKMPWMNRLSFKILLAYVGGAVLSIVLIVAIAFAILYSQGDVVYGFDVADTAGELASELRFDKDGIPIAIGDDDASGGDGEAKFDEEAKELFESLKREAAYRVVDASGKEVLSSAPGVSFWPSSGAERLLKPGRFDFDHDGVAMRGATEAVEHDGRVWYVQFVISRRFLRLMYQEFALPFSAVGVTLFTLVLLLVFGPCIYFTLRVALKPMRDLSEAAAGISPKSMHVRLSTHKVPHEIAPFVDSFNRVLERLEEGYRNQREFLSTAAHELKTPLALIRAQVELIARSAQSGMLLQDVEHMSRHVQQLLHLAEASEVQNYKMILVSMDDLVAEAVNYLRRMADAADVRLEIPWKHGGRAWLADRGALFTLLKNLLENAIQHTPAGMPVSVEVDERSVTVRDWGPGVPQEQISLVFDRFWRGAHRRDKGAGLGMAICKEIAQAHGWTLTASRAEPGLRVVVQRTVAAEE